LQSHSDDGDVPYNPRRKCRRVRHNDVVSSIPLQLILRSSGPINGLGLFAFERTTSFPHRFSDLFMFNHQGSTEVSVSSPKEMAWLLALTNQSIRSHAIFTITVEQMRKINTDSPENGIYNGSLKEEYLCAKLHIVYVAGSERANRTGSDGMKVKEGVYINKGFLALGNVITALEDERKRKDGAHCLLLSHKLLHANFLALNILVNAGFVSLMLAMWVSACISTADINAEETLNTVKYAIRARNIRNKPVVNRDHVSSEMLKMRQQLEYLQAELPLRNGGSSCANSRIAYLETLMKTFAVNSISVVADMLDEIIGLVKPDGLKKSLHSMESSNCAMVEATIGDSREIDEEAKEWEHKLLQSSMDKELHELNRCLEEKELPRWRMKRDLFSLIKKDHFELLNCLSISCFMEERNRLLAGIDNLASVGEAQKLQDVHAQNLKSLAVQLQNLKKKKENHCQLLKQKQKSDDAAQRKSEYERHKLQASNQRQKMNTQFILFYTNEKALQRWLDHELEVMVNVHEVQETKPCVCVPNAFSLCNKLIITKTVHFVWLALSKSFLQVEELAVKGLSPPRGKNGFVRGSSLSPNARMARISSLENSSAYLQIL
ncbi:LOW QUALITY PROTEIN: hypothetical protein HID58_093525, partial [Brassica napus]